MRVVWEVSCSLARWLWWSPRCSTGCQPPGMTDMRRHRQVSPSYINNLPSPVQTMQSWPTFTVVICWDVTQRLTIILPSVGSSIYPSKLGSESSHSGSSPYFSPSMQSAYGQQGNKSYRVISGQHLLHIYCSDIEIIRSDRVVLQWVQLRGFSWNSNFAALLFRMEEQFTCFLFKWSEWEQSWKLDKLVEM